MKKQIICLIFIVVLTAGTFQNVSSSGIKDNPNISISSDIITFSEAILKEKDSYLSVEVGKASLYLTIPGEPMLPVYTKTFTFPLGTKILDVICKPENIYETKISEKIRPAPELNPKFSIKTSPKLNDDFENDDIYSSTDAYPNSWFDYRITCGIQDEKNLVFLTIKLYPVRYSPGNNLLYQTKGFDLKIKYDESDKIKSFADDYDMVIIAPKKWSRLLQPLIDHKNNVGVKTFLKTTESICRRPILGGYEGRDDAEQIKYFIKDAIETYGIKYVLLVGGRVGQLYRWNVPVRYSNIDEGSFWERSFLSDLYFADIYRYNDDTKEYEFDDWDSDGDGIFSEWRLYEEPDDIIDFNPDVYLGRLACRNRNEVKLLVNKIISYETNTFGKEWFKNIILVGGDTFNTTDSTSKDYPYYEGEIETRIGGDYLKPLGFNSTEIFTSTGNLTSAEDIINAINKGSGFVFFSGHANPLVWSTHPPNADEDVPGQIIWVDFYSSEMRLLNNVEKLPICVVGGCHNSQFDVTNLNLITGFLKERLKYFKEPGFDYDEGGFWKAEWASRCWSWNLVIQKEGGSIATIGNTGLGYANMGYALIEDGPTGDGWITSHFFKVYHDLSLEGNNTLGQIHTRTVTDYITEFDVDKDQIDAKTVQQWALLGDPSIRIRG
ncbi:MAG: peptidase C25 [Candidatus Asgardarchaeum californiense]|nr:MAG: peptidase C25 [Candidatus Asgardarchaeum californiense]